MGHFKITFRPGGRCVVVRAGATLFEAAGRAGIFLNAACGGRGTCGKCRLELQDGREVLACQYQVDGDLDVFVPASSIYYGADIQQGSTEGSHGIYPAVCKKYIKVDSSDAAEAARQLNSGSHGSVYQISSDASRQLAQSGGGALTAVCKLQQESGRRQSWEVFSFEVGDTTPRLYGLAVDIGTTTVAARLVDLANGRSLAGLEAINPQSVYGHDVVSRISHAADSGGLKQLQDMITQCVGHLAETLCRAAGTNPSEICELCVVGNTTMTHIFLGLPVESLGQAPYQAYCLQPEDRVSTGLLPALKPGTNVHVVPGIAGFVGSDITAVAMAVGVESMDKTTLVIDIGTNGEMILVTPSGEIFAASCAAGPAFEGACISSGSRAVGGAIQAVHAGNDDIDLEVLGGGRAESICGSGLVDIVAVLLDLGVIDSTGRFVDPQTLFGRVPPAVVSRIIHLDGQPAFALWRQDGEDASAVLLTQADVRQLQLGKAAIRAAVDLLCRKTGIVQSEIERILLAGTFGNYLRSASVLKIGLLGSVEPARIRSVGNAAVRGAQMVLVDRHVRTRAAEIARRIRYVEIAHERDFVDIFTSRMAFGD